MDTSQYKPVSTLETDTNDGLSVRLFPDMLADCNNAKVYACRQTVRAQFIFPALFSLDNTLTEHVLAVMLVPGIPEGYIKLLWHQSHQRTAGASTTTWKLYHQPKIYRGVQNPIDTTWITGATAAASIVTDNNAWRLGHATLTIDEGLVNLTYLILTATNGDGSTRAKITSLAITPQTRF